MNMKRTLFYIIICSSFISCVPTVHYNPDTKNEYKGSGEPESSTYIYPFNDESQNNISEITIESNKVINPDSVNIGIPPLKYNKEWLCLLTLDDCVHSAYSYTWAAINDRPQTTKYFYDVQHLIAGDLPPDTFSYHKTLGSTDGAGNEVRFAFTVALYQENKDLNDLPYIEKGFTNNYFRFYMKSTLIWSDIKDMLNYGEGIAFHDASTNAVNNEDSLIKHFYIGEDSVQKHLSGRGCKMLAEPDGNIHYINAAIKFPGMQTMTAQGDANYTLYPFKVNTDLEKAVIARDFYNTPYDIEYAVVKNLLSFNKEYRPAICIGSHRTYNDMSELLLWLNNKYGKDGDDTMWFPSQEEYFEYCYYRAHAEITKSIDGKTLKITVSMPSNTYFYYPSITVNVSGMKKEDVKSITSSDNVTGLSYANYNNELMLNINCRKHLLDLAQHYMSVYLANKTEYTYLDAKYFVNMLKPSTDKDALLEQLK